MLDSAGTIGDDLEGSDSIQFEEELLSRPYIEFVHPDDVRDLQVPLADRHVETRDDRVRKSPLCDPGTVRSS